jgi:ferritin-like metal-binding protein YciE
MKSTTIKTDKKVKLQEGKGNSENAISETKENCRNVFVEELKEIYFTEKALILSIPIMIKNATTDELIDALKVHLQFTQEHIQRLEFFFTSIGEAGIMLKYEAMYGSITPG